MCTVTIVPLIEGDPSDSKLAERSATARHPFRVACNRDELRTRDIARPPVIRRIGERQAIMPIDPESDGTWVAVNDFGVVMTLLNVNRSGRSSTIQGGEREGSLRSAKRSRGEVIPCLIGAVSADEAGESSCARLSNGGFKPFRLIIVDERAEWDVLNDGAKLTARRTGTVRHPVMYTSSGLGDHLVEPPRRALFEESFTDPIAWVREQDAFHRHSWPKRTRVSVCMSRDDARTVSHTVVEVLPQRVRMIYYPDSPDSGLQPVTLELERTITPP